MSGKNHTGLHNINGLHNVSGLHKTKGLHNAVFACLLFLTCLVLCGCGGKKTEIIFTTDFEEQEVFRIEDTSCYLPEIMVYLVNSENRYDEIFGEQIWQVPIHDSTVEKEYKETILARIAQIKVMNLFAKDRGVELSDEELKLAEEAANTYFQSLNAEEVRTMDVSVGTIRQLYEEFALANKLYHSIVDEVNPEISDDEARAVSVKSILIKTYTTTNQGTRIEFTDMQRKEAFNKAEEALIKITEGTDFDIVAADYNEDSQDSYTFGRGVMPKPIEDVAFNLGMDEISGLIATEYGYHILKCTSKFDRDETDANKAGIVAKHKQETFNALYDEFVQGLTSNLNGPLWESVTYQKTPQNTTTSFFDVYDSYFLNEL